AGAYVKQGAEPMAVTQLQKSLQIDSTQVDARLTLAGIHARAHRWAEAGKLYQQTLRFDPKNDTASLELGRIYMKAKQPLPAARAFALYVPRHPEDLETASQYLDALIAAGRDEEAANAAAALLVAHPDWPPALAVAARSEARLGHADKALPVFLALDKKQPLQGADAMAVGSCYVTLGRDTDAAPWFDRAVADAGAAIDWGEPGAAFMRLHRGEDASVCYERKLAHASTNAAAWTNWARCKQQLTDNDSARRGFLRAIAQRPESVRDRFDLANVYVIMDSTRAARRSYETVVGLAGGRETECREELRQSYRWLSTADLVDKQWQSALRHLDGALRLDPDDVELRLYRAQALFQ